MSQPLTNSSPLSWWHEFFDETYGEHGLAKIDPEVTEQAVAFLIDKLDLNEGQTVFDQCCGLGRLSLPMAERGVRVIGVDLSRPYIERAKTEADRRSLPCTFHCADAFDFVADLPCDAAINWFTSFGYADDDDHNARMLRRAMESLKPGGRFALECANLTAIFADFRPQMIQRPSANDTEVDDTDADDPDGMIILQENRADLATGTLHSRWTFLFPNGSRRVRHVRTRMYLPHTIVSMLRGCGLVDIELFGSTGGEPLELNSPRCIALGRKP